MPPEWCDGCVVWMLVVSVEDEGGNVVVGGVFLVVFAVGVFETYVLQFFEGTVSLFASLNVIVGVGGEGLAEVGVTVAFLFFLADEFGLVCC